eukprot:Ihof_evm20s32 gene=Ihof_evmTU20s32
MSIPPVDIPIDAPLKAVMTERVNDYRDLIQKFLLAVSAQIDGSQRGKDVRTPKDILADILQQDRLIQAGCRALHQHQNLQRRLDLVQSAIASQDVLVVELSTRLKKAETTLDTVLCEARKRLDIIKQATEAAVDLDELVHYAGVTSYTVAPPPNWVQGTLAPFSGPHPNDGDMKRSHMFMKKAHGFYNPPKQEPIIAPVATPTPSVTPGQ